MNVYRIEGITQSGGIVFIHVLASAIEEAIAHAKKDRMYEVTDARKCLTEVQTIEVKI